MPIHVKTVSILMPVYNEAGLLPHVLHRVEAVDHWGLATDIIIMDDGSDEGATEIPRTWIRQGLPYNIRFHDRNRGKGAVRRTAITMARGEIIAIQEADLEYKPADYPALLRFILEDAAHAV